MSMYRILRTFGVPHDLIGTVLAIHEGITKLDALQAAIEAKVRRTPHRHVTELESLGLVDVVRNGPVIVSFSLVTNLSQQLLSNAMSNEPSILVNNTPELGVRHPEHKAPKAAARGLEAERAGAARYADRPANLGQICSETRESRQTDDISVLAGDLRAELSTEISPRYPQNPQVPEISTDQPVTWRNQDRQLLQQLFTEHPRKTDELARDPWGCGYIFPWSRRSTDVTSMVGEADLVVPGMQLREIYIAITFMEFRYGVDLVRTKGIWTLIRAALRETKAAVLREGGAIRVPSRLFQSILYERIEDMAGKAKVS